MLPVTLIFTVAATLYGVAQPNQQRYSQYSDQETAVVMRPEGYENRFGDGVWRSSWFYGSLLVIREKAPDTYDRLKDEHGVDVGQAEKFLRYFRDNCMRKRGRG